MPARDTLWQVSIVMGPICLLRPQISQQCQWCSRVVLRRALALWNLTTVRLRLILTMVRLPQVLRTEPGRRLTEKSLLRTTILMSGTRLR